MRVRLWVIVLIFTGVLIVGLISLPLALFMPLDDVFGDGGVADQLLNVFTYGLLFIFLVIPPFLGGIVLIWQPRGDGKFATEASHSGMGRKGTKGQPHAVPVQPEHYRLWKLAVGVLLVWFAVMLTREVFTSDTPFPTSKADAARRAGQD